jgi:ribosome-binding protein aMBF1 (putative translation factor)
MPVCRECEDEVDELVKVKVGKKTMKLCEDCADRVREEQQVAEDSEAVIQDMMGFKGRR